MRKLCYIAFILIITGCTYSSSPYARQLDLDARLIQSDPSEAWSRLNTYDVSEFEDSAIMARWALLYTEAMVANNLACPTDTIVNIALNYYGNHRDEEAFRHASRLKALMHDSLHHDELATALYLQKEKEFMVYRERARNVHNLTAGLFLLLLAAAIIVWQRQRLKIKDAQHSQTIAEASQLRRSLQAHRSTCSELEAKLSAILATRFKTIDELCETYYETQGTKNERKAIAENVQKQIAAAQSDKEMFAEMEECVNNCSGNILDKLRSQWPDIKSGEYQMFVYLSCHLSNRTIALLLGENINVVYKRKSRLKARIAELSLPDTPLFLSVFQ